MKAAVEVTADMLRKIPLPQPSAEGDKEERGRVLVIAGSPELPGGAILAGVGALRAGAGKLQIAVPQSIALAVGVAVPESLVAGMPETPNGSIDPSAAALLDSKLKRCDAVLVGPGMTGVKTVARLTTRLLDREPGPAYLLDAAGMEQLTAKRELLAAHKGRIVITPHAGEMAHLLGIAREEVEADPLRVACEAARDLRVVVSLKGKCTHVAAPDGGTWAVDQGHVGLATSGSGDTLAGIVAGLLARGTPPAHAAVWGAYMHGQAGRRLAKARGSLGFLARELLAEIPAIMAELSAPA
jgi:hydroxyethylthiazole kinase-like uncharacterized protein yjeF